MAKQSRSQKNTVGRVMHEFKHGELKSSAGRKVKNPKQAIAIGLREAGASKNESPKKNKENLGKTTARERKAETAQDRAEGGSSRSRASAGRSGSKSTAAAGAKGKSKSTAASGTAKAKSRSTAASGTAKGKSRSTAASGTAKGKSRSTAASGTGKGKPRSTAASGSRKGKPRTTASSGATDKTRQELYAEAQRRDLPGRSKMSKSELQRALRT